MRLGGVAADRPYPPSGMTTALWMEQPVADFDTADLWATQAGVYFAALIDTSPSIYSRDRYPHVVQWQGRAFLEDGHHRLMRALLLGQHTITCRYITISTSGSGSGSDSCDTAA